MSFNTLPLQDIWSMVRPYLLPQSWSAVSLAPVYLAIIAIVLNALWQVVSVCKITLSIVCWCLCSSCHAILLYPHSCFIGSPFSDLPRGTEMIPWSFYLNVVKRYVSYHGTYQSFFLSLHLAVRQRFLLCYVGEHDHCQCVYFKYLFHVAISYSAHIPLPSSWNRRQ